MNEPVESLLTELVQQIKAQTEALHDLASSNRLLVEMFIDQMLDEVDDEGRVVSYLDGAPAGNAD